MKPSRITVLLPCRSLEDFPSWLHDAEAGDLLEAWVAAWHPSLLAATGRLPEAGSLDRDADDVDETVFVVPAAFDDRLSAIGIDASGTARLVRGQRDREGIARAALAHLTGETAPSPLPCPHADDFHALGLARLLAELLARRMRSSLAIDEEAFRAAAGAAAEAALAGDGEAMRDRLTECFATLSASRKRYYPVDIWLLDLVLLAGSTLGDTLAAELLRPGPRVVIATGQLVERLGETRGDLATLLRERLSSGTLAAASGLYDDSAIHRLSSDEMLASLRRGRGAWESVTGHLPTTFARRTGGLAAILPKLLLESGFTSAIYRLFDGSRLPDPAASRLRWESPSGDAIEGISCPPIDARSTDAGLSLADTIGDTLDHSHNAILAFAHYPGTAQRWYDDVRRIAEWSDFLGRFVLPEHLIRETMGMSTRADFQPDAFPGPSPLASDFDPQPEAAARPLSTASQNGHSAAVAESRGGLFGLLRTRRKTADDTLRLDNGLVSLRVHAETGGMLAFREAGSAANRLSQRLAVRTTPSLAAGNRWADPLDRAEYSQMAADSIAAAVGPGGERAIESRGRLFDEKRLFGTFRQKVWLEPALAIARFEIAIDLASPLPVATDAADWFHASVVCRFAWNENVDVELFRSLHGESWATERSVFFAKHFVEFRGIGSTLLTGGLPWHVRSSPHMLDTILIPSAFPEGTTAIRTPEAQAERGVDSPHTTPDAPRTDASRAFPLKITRHLAVGLGLSSPGETSLTLAGEARPAALAEVAS